VDEFVDMDVVVPAVGSRGMLEVDIVVVVVVEETKVG